MSEDMETNPNNVPVRRRPVNIPLVERINKHHDEDFIDRPRDENHIPMNNSNGHMLAHDDISKTPDEHDLMNELDKLFAKNGISEEVSYSPTTSDSSSKSQSSIPKKNSLQTLRRSPSLNKYTAHNPTFKELQPKSSNETLTLDEDGHDSSMEDICASDQYMNVDEVDAMPLSLSPKMVYSPKHQQQLDDISEDFVDLIKVEEEEEDDDEDMPFPSMEQNVVFSNADDHDYNIPVENKRLRMELDKKAKSLENMYRDDLIFDNSYESNAMRSISKASLDWEYKEYQEFILEVEHWFCLTLGLDSKIMESNISNNTLFNDMIWYVKELQDLTKLANFDDLNEMSFNSIEMCQRLLHYTLGNFIRTAVKSESDDDLQHFMNDEYQQFKFLERRMIINCKVILKDKDLLHKVLCMVKQHMTLVKLENDNHITVYNTLLKLSSSILFIIVCACLQDINNDYIETFRELIDELDFMSFITEYMESWRFTYKPSMNMRLILVLFNKLIIFQFGTSSELKDIHTKINDDVSAGSGKNCNSFDVSQYESIRQDLITRYPELSLEIEIIDEYKYDMSYSSVQFINVPRPKKDMLSNMIANGKNVGSLFNNSVPNIQLVGSTTTTTDPYNMSKRTSNSTNISIPMIQPTNDQIKIIGALKEKIELLKDSLKNRDVKSMQIAYWKIRYYYYELGIESTDIEINTKDGVIQKDKIDFDEGEQNQHYERIHNYYLANHHRLGSLTIIILKLLENLSIAEDSLTSILRSNIIEVLMNLLIRFSQQNAMKGEYLKTIIFDYRGIEIFCDILKNENVDRYMTLFYHKEKWTFWNYLKEFCHEYKNQNDIVVSLNIESCYDDIDQDYDSRYLNMEYGLLYCLEKVIDGRTQRLKFLPLNIGTLFKSQYKIYNLCIYKPLLELIRQLTPFKSKKWRAEHMELITGVYMYLKLPLIENDWVTGKDTNGEILDAVNIELGIRSLIKFYNVMIKKKDELPYY